MARAQLPRSSGGMSAGSVARRPRVRVYSKPAWDGQWQPANFLWPLQASVSAAPQKSTATFEWLVGRVKNAGATSFGVQHDLDLRDKFVKVVRLGDNAGSPASPSASSVLWVGRISDSDLDVHGLRQGDNGQLVNRGRRVHRAVGMEHELDRSPIRDSLVTNDGEECFFVDAPLVFNEQFEGPSGLNRVGNRSAQKVPHPDDPLRIAYAFAGAKGQTAPWTVADIVEHLVTFHRPAGMRFTLGGQVAALRQLVMPRVDVSGRTVWQALNYLIDRSRGLGWCLRYTEDGGTGGREGRFEVHVYSVLDEPVVFEDATIGANPERLTLDTSGLDHLVDEQSLQVDTVGRFGKVVVSGRPVLSCFTLNVGTDETLEKGWTPAEETTYRHASDTGDQEKNRAARAVDSLAHVYRHFHVPKAFGWRTGNGSPSGKVNANPYVDLYGRVGVGNSLQNPIRDWGHRFERHLPLRKTQLKADSEPEYLEPFALVQEATGAWVYADNADPAKGSSGSVRMLDTAFGVEVRFTPNHVLALGQFDQPATEGGVTGIAAKPDKVAPAYDFTTMLVTVAARLDARLRVILEIEREGPLKDRVLFLEVPDAELHYVVPGTVTGVNPAGVLQFSTAQDALLRDDGDRLRRIAAMAKAWYGKDRSAMQLTVNDLWQRHPVGSLVLAVTDQRKNTKPVNTPVSQVIYDLVRMKTTVRTNWSELDVTAGRSAGRKRT